MMCDRRYTGAAIGIQFANLFICLRDDVYKVTATIGATLVALLAPSGDGQDAIIDVRHVDGLFINDVEGLAVILGSGPMNCAAPLDT